jgi:hypothetical protein
VGTKITYKSAGHNPDGDNRANLKCVPEVDAKANLKKIFSDPLLVVIQVSDSEVFAVNKLRFKRKPFLLLEPNPVTFYFSIVYDLIPQISKAKYQLKLFLDCGDERNPELPVVFSYVFKVASIGIIFSFSALEASMNQLLPDFKEIEFKGKLVSKNEIQRWATFDDKLIQIIPKIHGKNFCELYPKKAEVLKNMKKLRDELIHLKQKRKDGFASYNDIYQDVLNLNLKRIVFTVKSFINFYQPGLIQNYRNRMTKIQ